MGERKWWPTEWADEVMPPGRATPNDFIIPVNGRFFIGYALDAKDADEHEKRVFNREVDTGDIVGFFCCDPLGEVDVTINPDGTYDASGPVPERATHFWLIGDSDTLSGTMADFVKNYLEVEPITEPRTETVSMAWWSEEQPHKLTMSYHASFLGSASFIAVSKSEAKQ